MQRLTDVLKSQLARFALAYDAATVLANGAWRLVVAFTVTLYTLGIACAQLGPNLVTNGSFKTPIGDNGWGSNPATWFAGETFDGWTVTQDSVDIVRFGAPGSSYDGVQLVDLNGSPGVGGIRQDITIANRGIYRLHFALSGNTGVDPDSSRIVRVQLSLGATDAFNSTFTWNLSDHPGHDAINLPSWDVYQVDFLVPTAGIYTNRRAKVHKKTAVDDPLVYYYQRKRLAGFPAKHNGRRSVRPPGTPSPSGANARRPHEP
jgi:hypothetical protein